MPGRERHDRAADMISLLQDVRLLLAPLAREDVKTVRCLGLNYSQHAIEVIQAPTSVPGLPTSQLTPRVDQHAYS